MIARNFNFFRISFNTRTKNKFACSIVMYVPLKYYHIMFFATNRASKKKTMWIPFTF